MTRIVKSQRSVSAKPRAKARAIARRADAGLETRLLLLGLGLLLLASAGRLIGV